MNKDGCGLGLSISKNLTEALGGSIHVESKVDEGSKFTIVLPHKKQVISLNDSDEAIELR